MNHPLARRSSLGSCTRRTPARGHNPSDAMDTRITNQAPDKAAPIHPACPSHGVRDFAKPTKRQTHRLPKWTRLDLGRINVQDGVQSCATSPARSSRAWREGEEEEVGFSSFREGNATKSLEPGQCHILHLTHQFKRRAAQPARMWARKRWEVLHLQFWGRLLVAMRPCSPSLPQEGNLSAGGG